jgi:hypothetical protein
MGEWGVKTLKKMQVTHHTLKFLDASIFGCTNSQWK